VSQGSNLTGRRGALGRCILGVVAAAGLSACSATFQDHGYIPPPEDLAGLRLGVDTQETVAEAVGRPLTVGVIDENVWFYVRERVRHDGWRPPEPVERQLLAMSFTEDGRLVNVARLSLRDGRIVELSRRVTDTTVRDFGLVQQLLRNLGRVDIAQDIADAN
jgi:outer membrane protein assembly factor BamE (lipoprotein component of BamABCDE complex)